MATTRTVYRRVTEYARQPDARFLELGRSLTRLRDYLKDTAKKSGAKKTGQSPSDELHLFAENNGISRRKIYYLLEVDRVFGHSKVPNRRLKKIGWSKLGIIAPYVDAGNMEELLTLAEQHTAMDIKAILVGANKDRHCVMFYFTETEYSIVKAHLLEFGACEHGNGLKDKEAALLAICATPQIARKAVL